MGTANYITSKFINLAYPLFNEDDYDRAELIEYMDIDEDADDEEFYEAAYSAYRMYAEDDCYMAKQIIKKNPLTYFDISIEPGYYEGFSIDIKMYADFADEDEIVKEADKAGKILRELVDDCGLRNCYSGWKTSFDSYEETLEEIDSAVEEMKNEARETIRDMLDVWTA